jgi:hypothetical protein
MNMYFRPAEYPLMQGYSKSEQLHILRLAIGKYGVALSRRWIAAVVSVVGVSLLSFAVFLELFDDSTALLVSTACCVAYMLVFYLYLLWEINGAVFNAVEALFRELDDIESPSAHIPTTDVVDGHH